MDCKEGLSVLCVTGLFWAQRWWSTTKAFIKELRINLDIRSLHFLLARFFMESLNQIDSTKTNRKLYQWLYRYFVKPQMSLLLIVSVLHLTFHRFENELMVNWNGPTLSKAKNSIENSMDRDFVSRKYWSASSRMVWGQANNGARLWHISSSLSVQWGY